MVEINGFNNKVLCTGAECECCKAGLKRTLKIMMPLFNNETQQIELWERGINQIKDLQTMLAEYGDLSQETFKIVRSGKAKSKDTKYSMVYVKKGIETDIEYNNLVRKYNDLIDEYNALLTAFRNIFGE